MHFLFNGLCHKLAADHVLPCCLLSCANTQSTSRLPELPAPRDRGTAAAAVAGSFPARSPIFDTSQ